MPESDVCSSRLEGKIQLLETLKQKHKQGSCCGGNSVGRVGNDISCRCSVIRDVP